MEITSFILGVCAVIVVAMVVGTFVNYMSVKRLKEQLDTLDRDVQNQLEAIIRDNNALENKLTDYVDSLHKISEDTTNEIYRYIDSRNDKLQSQFKDQMASGIEVKRALDEIREVKIKLDEFITTYQNI